MKEKGKSEKKINKEISEYNRRFNQCGTIVDSTLNSYAVIVKEGWREYIYPKGASKNSPYKPIDYIDHPPETQSFFYYATHNYELMYNLFIESFRMYMNQMIALVDISI